LEVLENGVVEVMRAERNPFLVATKRWNKKGMMLGRPGWISADMNYHDCLHVSKKKIVLWLCTMLNRKRLSVNIVERRVGDE
jgi:hypothetical protein